MIILQSKPKLKMWMLYKKFRNSFEEKCFQLIVDAYHASIAEKIIQSSDSEDIIGNFAIGDDYEKFRIDFKKKKASLVKMFTLTRQDYDTYRVPPKKDYTDEKSIPFYK